MNFRIILSRFQKTTEFYRSEVKCSHSVVSDPVECSLPGFSVHGILQARTLESVAISFSRGSYWPRNWTQVSRSGGRRFNLWATREAPEFYRNCPEFIGLFGGELTALQNWGWLSRNMVSFHLWSFIFCPAVNIHSFLHIFDHFIPRYFELLLPL